MAYLRSGALQVIPAATGVVLQVQSATTTAAETTTSGSWLVVPALTITMTDIQSTSSKFLIVTHLNVGGLAGSNAGGGFQLFGNSGVIDAATGAAAGSRTRVTSQAALGANTWRMFTRGFSYLDSPSSVSDQLYAVHWRTQGSTTYLNQPAATEDDADRVRGMSSIIVMEIA